MSPSLFFDSKEYISSKEASSLTGYSRDYIGQLARANKIDSRRIGRTLYVGKNSLLQYKNLPIEPIAIKSPERVLEPDPIPALQREKTSTKALSKPLMKKSLPVPTGVFFAVAMASLFSLYIFSNHAGKNFSLNRSFSNPDQLVANTVSADIKNNFYNHLIDPLGEIIFSWLYSDTYSIVLPREKETSGGGQPPILPEPKAASAPSLDIMGALRRFFSGPLPEEIAREFKKLQNIPGPKGPMGPAGPQGLKGENADPALFVARTFFDTQISKIFDVIEKIDVGDDSGSGSVSGTNTGDVTLAGTPDYITIAGQVITRNKLDPADDINTFASSVLSDLVTDETGSGAAVFANSPVFTTPNIGSATGSISGNAGTVTVADAAGDATTSVLLGTSATGSLSPATDAGLTYDAATDALSISGTISASNFSGTASGTNTGDVTLAGAPDYITIAGQVITRNKLDPADDINTFASSVLSDLVTDEIGTGSAVFNISPTLVTPNIGAATATSLVNPTFTTSSGAMNFTPAAGSGFNINLSTTGDFAVNTDDLFVDTSSSFVGIGSSSPDSLLDLESSNPILTLNDTTASSTQWQIRNGTAANGKFDIYDATNDESMLTIIPSSSGGQLIVGADSNAGGLGNASRLFVFGGQNGANIDVMGDSAVVGGDQAVIELQSSDYATSFKSTYLQYNGVNGVGTTMGFSNVHLGQLTFQDASTALIRTTNAIPIIFGTNNTERMRLDASGNLGIGDTSPAALLTVGSGDLFQVNASGAITAVASITSSGDITVPDEVYGVGWNGSTEVPTKNAVYDKLELFAAGTGIDHGGLTGLLDDDHAQYALLAGRSSGQTLIGGTGVNDDLVLRTTSGVGTTGADMIFQVGNNGGTEAVRILNSGNVGIGTTAPVVKLDTAGTGRFTAPATSVLTGSIDPDGTTTVTGVGTSFTTELIAGDRITVSGETRTITAIASNTSLTVDTAFSNTANDTSPDRLPAMLAGRDSSNNMEFAVNDQGAYVRTLRVQGDYSSQPASIELFTDPALNDRAYITSYGFTGEAEGKISFATGNNPIFEIDSGENNEFNFLTDSGYHFKIDPGAVEAVTIAADGNVGLGDTTPDYLLELQDATNTPDLALSDDDVAHGLTTLAQTDVFSHLTSLSTTAGGVQWTTISDTDAQALSIRGVMGSTNPTDATPAIKIIGAKSNGTTGIADLAAAETVFQVANNDDTSAITVLGSGNVGINLATPNAKLDIIGINDANYIQLLASTSTYSYIDAFMSDSLTADEFGSLHFYMNPEEGFNVVNSDPSGLTTSSIFAGEGAIEFYFNGSPLLSMSAGTAIFSGALYANSGVTATGDLVLLDGGDNARIEIQGDGTIDYLSTSNYFTGSIGIGDVTPDYSLEIYDATNTPISVLSDDDVAHGLTTLAQTDVFSHLTSLSTTAGGTEWTSISDTDAQALSIRGVMGSTNPTDTLPAIKIIGAKSNGTTGIADLAAAETVFQVANNDDTAALTILGDGKIGIGTTTPGQALHVLSTADANNVLKVENSNGSGTSAAAVLNATADVANASLIAHGSGRTLQRYGITLGGYNELLSVTGNGLIMGTNNATPLVFGTNNTERLRILSGGNIGIGDTTPDYTLELSGATAPEFALADTGLAHGITSFAETDTYFNVEQITDDDGGARVWGFSDSAGLNPLRVIGAFGSTDPTDSVAAIQLIGVRRSGTTATTLADAETILSVTNNGNAKVSIMGNGSTGIGDITPDGLLDVEPTGAVTAASYGINLSNLTTNATTDNINKYGIYVTSTGTWTGGAGTATNNYGLYVDTVSGADNNYGAYFAQNVGIGTATPANPLDISTSSNSSVVARAVTSSTGTAASIGFRAENTTGYGAFFKTSTGWTTYKTIAANDTGFYNLTSGNISILNDVSGGDIWLTGGAASAPHLIVDTTGNIGAGDTSPDYLLELYDVTNTPAFALSDDDVAHGVTTVAETDVFSHLSSISTTVGGAQLTGLADATGIALGLKGIQSSDPTDTTPAVSVIGTKASGTGVQDLAAAETVFQVANNDNAAALTVLGDDKVGIGDTTPGSNLEISSTGATEATINGTAANATLKLKSSGTLKWQMLNNTSLTDRLQITNGTNGVMMNQGDTLWSSVSDARLKENVETLSVLDRLDSYRAVTFNWKENSSIDRSLQVGVIAQELYEAFPEVVNKGSGDPDAEIAPMGANTWSVKYEALAPIALEGVKELDLKLESIALPLEAESEASFAERFFGKLAEWLGDAANGLGSVFANVFEAKEKICVDGECLTKEDIRALLLLAQDNGNSDAPDPEPEPVPEPVTEQTSETPTTSPDTTEESAPESDTTVEEEPAQETETAPQPEEEPAPAPTEPESAETAMQ